MGYSLFETKKLVLIPARYRDENYTSYYHSVSGGAWYISAYSISGAYWKSSAAGNYIEFGFKGPICGVLFFQKTGICDLIIDGKTIIDDLDVSTLKGSIYNCSYVFKEDLTEDFHVVRIKAEDAYVRIVGILADGRLNFFDHEYFPLAKEKVWTAWDTKAAAAGATSNSIFTYRVMKLGVYIKVSAASDVTLEVYTVRGWKTFKTYSFSAAGENVDVVGDFPFHYLRFKTSAAVTISAQAFFKR